MNIPFFRFIIVVFVMLIIALDGSAAAQDSAPESIEVAQAHLDQGLLYQSQGRYEQAAENFTQAIALDPNRADSYLYRAAVYHHLGDERQAIADLNYAIWLNSDPIMTASAFENRGLAYAAQGRFEMAIADLDQAIALNPNGSAYNNRGQVYQTEGDYERAAADFSRAVELAPDDAGYRNDLAQVYIYRGQSHLIQGNNEQGLADLREYARLTGDRAAPEVLDFIAQLEASASVPPDDAFEYVDRGMELLSRGDAEAALGDFNRAIEIDPAFAAAYFGRGQVEGQQGAYGLAAADLSHAIELSPAFANYASAHFMLGSAHLHLNGYVEAAAEFTRAIEIDPGLASAYLARAFTYTEMRDTAAASADYWQWITLNQKLGMDPSTISLGEPAAVEMRDGSVYRFSFEGDEGQVVDITGEASDSSDVDPLIVILNAAGEALIANDDSGEGYNSAIRHYALPASGSYTLVVSHAGGGTDGLIIVLFSLSGPRIEAERPAAHNKVSHFSPGSRTWQLNREAAAENIKVVNLTNQVDTERLMRHVENLQNFGTRHVNSPYDLPDRGIGAAYRYLIGQFEQIRDQSQGRLVVFAQPFWVNWAGVTSQGQNIAAFLSGTDRSAGAILIGAHYDSTSVNFEDGSANAPGANDNASGVSALIEMARVLSTRPHRATIIFVAFSAEEIGREGSLAFVQHYLRPRQIRLNAMINMDIIGSQTGPDGSMDNRHLRLFSAGPQDSLSRQLARAIELITLMHASDIRIQLQDTLDRYQRYGDHRSFSDAGYAAVRFIEPLEDTGRQHNDRDTIDDIQPGYFTRVTQTILTVVTALADGLRPPANIALREAGKGMRTLSWDSVSGASGYVVALRRPNALEYEYLKVDNLLTTRITWGGFMPNQFASVAIAVIDSNGLMGPLSPELAIP